MDSFNNGEEAIV